MTPKACTPDSPDAMVAVAPLFVFQFAAVVPPQQGDDSQIAFGFRHPGTNMVCVVRMDEAEVDRLVEGAQVAKSCLHRFDSLAPIPTHPAQEKQ
jgi:hypothetical protein